MKRYTRHIKGLFLLTVVTVCFTSCYDTEPYREVCDYKALLRYDYNEENTSRENRIEYNIHTIDEYIFDEAGILYAARRITPDVCREMMNAEWDLPPGKYSVIAIGNMDERSTPTDVRTGDTPEIGVTHREDMRLTLDNAATLADGHTGHSEKLYHGYKTFTVTEEGISRVRVDMVHSHFRLRFRVTWKYGDTPARGNYYATIGNVPSAYKLMPEFIYPAMRMDCKEHDCETDDLYPANCNEVIHHIAHTCYGQLNERIHRNDTYINADNEMWGEFVNYRIKAETPLLMRIYRAGDTRAGDQQIVKTLDLQDYFRWCEYDLDHTLKQDYLINIEVDGTTVKISSLKIGDWDEGGTM